MAERHRDKYLNLAHKAKQLYYQARVGRWISTIQMTKVSACFQEPSHLHHGTNLLPSTVCGQFLFYPMSQCGRSSL